MNMETIALKRGDIPDYDPTRDYYVTNIVGDCMNAPSSPAIVGDGGRVLCHRIDRAEFYKDWERYRGRGVVFRIIDGHPLAKGGNWMIKQFDRIDWGLFLVMRYHNPRITEFSIETDCVTDISIVDMVLT